MATTAEDLFDHLTWDCADANTPTPATTAMITATTTAIAPSNAWHT